MKKLLLLPLLLLSIFSFAQDAVYSTPHTGRIKYQSPLPIDSLTNRVVFTGVVEAPNETADELLSNAQLFITKTFKSGKAATQMVDHYAKSVAANGNFPVIYGYIEFQFLVQCKDGRYKYTINSFVHKNHNEAAGGYLSNEKPACGTFFMPRKMWANIKMEANTDVNQLIDNLEKQMKNNSSDNW